LCLTFWTDSTNILCPMPLKHPTETLLMFLLSLAIVATGVVMSILPAFPDGAAFWGIAWIVSVAYPVFLYPFLRLRRADYVFRVLHFVPMTMLLLWMVLEVGSLYSGDIEVVRAWYMWGSGIIAVTVSFVLLSFFSWNVIRQRGLRLVLLTFVFVPFAVLGVGESQFGMQSNFTGLLTQVSEWKERLLNGEVFDEEGSEKNLLASADQEEEVWRMRLRRMERREDRIDSKDNGGSQNHVPTDPPKDVLIAPRDRTSSSSSVQSAGLPPALVSSGIGGMEVVGLFLLAGYCGLVHHRARRRMMS